MMKKFLLKFVEVEVDLDEEEQVDLGEFGDDRCYGSDEILKIKTAIGDDQNVVIEDPQDLDDEVEVDDFKIKTLLYRHRSIRG